MGMTMTNVLCPWRDLYKVRWRWYCHLWVNLTSVQKLLYKNEDWWFIALDCLRQLRSET